METSFLLYHVGMNLLSFLCYRGLYLLVCLQNVQVDIEDVSDNIDFLSSLAGKNEGCSPGGWTDLAT